MATKTEMDWVRIERTFDAPIEKVWAMWTDPALFQQWYGPKGMTIPEAEMTLTVGGRRMICMSMETPERTMKMWFTGEYKEINAPTRLVYTESMCDENGNILTPQQMGMPDGPASTEVIIDLSDLGGKTKMAMTHVGVPAGTQGEGGWMQAMEKLAALLGPA